MAKNATNQNNSNNKIGLYIFVGIILFSSIGSFVSVSKSAYLLAFGKSTTAIISEYVPIEHHNKGGVYYSYVPVLNFDVYGKNISVQSNIDNVSEKYDVVGSTVKVKYNASNPYQVLINEPYYTISTVLSLLFSLSMIFIIGMTRILSLMSIGNVLTFKVPWKNKAIACLLGSGFAILAVFCLINNYLLEKTLISSDIFSSILSIAYIFVYVLAIINTIKSYIIETTKDYIF